MNGSSIGWVVLDFFHFRFIGLKSVSLSGLFSGDFQEIGGLYCDSGVWDDGLSWVSALGWAVGADRR